MLIYVGVTIKWLGAKSLDCQLPADNQAIRRQITWFSAAVTKSSD